MSVLMIVAMVASAIEVRQDNRATESMVNRLKDRLKLSDEQATKLKEILTGDSDERAKLDEARTGKINALLDEDQRKQFDEFRSQQQRAGRTFGSGAPPGVPGPFGGGQNRPMGSLQIEDVKKELSLTDEQVEKLKPLYDEFNDNHQKRTAELAANGFQGINFAEVMQKYQENLRQLTEKVKVHLTDEQKTKLDARVEQMNGMLRFLPALMNRNAGGERAAVRPSVEERVRLAMAALKVEKEDEGAAIAELIAKVVKAQYNLEDFTKSSRESLAEAAKNRELSDAAIEDRIKEAQEERRKREKEIAGFQKQLVEVVTNRQEIELMALGILK
jgi:hypothetical protein